MNKSSEKKLNTEKASRIRRGFSLVETLMTVLILLLVSSCAAMAISFGTVEYRKSMNQSLAQMLYSTIQTSVESHLKYADHENTNYVLQDGMLYLNTESGLKPVLENAAYTGLNLKDFNLNYNAGKHCYTVSFSVCAGDDVLINGEKYSFDVWSLPSMLGFTDVPGSSYKPQRVQDSAIDFEEPINIVIRTLYDKLVEPRLSGGNGQVSYVLFNGGVIKSVCVYTEKSINGGFNITSDINTADLDKMIADALSGTGYKLSGTCRVFFDREGNCISNYDPEKGVWKKIGGQGTGASLQFTKNSKNSTIRYYNDDDGWYK